MKEIEKCDQRERKKPSKEGANGRKDESYFRVDAGWTSLVWPVYVPLSFICQ